MIARSDFPEIDVRQTAHRQSWVRRDGNLTFVTGFRIVGKSIDEIRVAEQASTS